LTPTKICSVNSKGSLSAAEKKCRQHMSVKKTQVYLHMRMSTLYVDSFLKVSLCCCLSSLDNVWFAQESPCSCPSSLDTVWFERESLCSCPSPLDLDLVCDGITLLLLTFVRKYIICEEITQLVFTFVHRCLICELITLLLYT
jgi:hypothetical protein